MLKVRFRRRREEKTDYKQRLALLKSGKTRIVIRRSAKSFRIQFVKWEGDYDKTVYECTSKILNKFDWKGHGGSISSAYLCGLVAGFEAQKNGVKEAVIDIGRHISIKGSSIYAAALGVKDSGIDVNIGKKIVPDYGRISGKHVAEYAKILKKNKGKYEKQFSAYIKSGFDPENITEHFKDVKSKILTSYGSSIKAEEGDEEWEDAE